MEFWNTVLSIGLISILGVIGFQARTVLNNTRRLDTIEGAGLPKRLAAVEKSSGDVDARMAAIETQEKRLESIENELKTVPERIATLEAHDFRTTTDQLHSRVNSLDRSVARFRWHGRPAGADGDRHQLLVDAAERQRVNYAAIRVRSMRRTALLALSLSPDYTATLSTLRKALSGAGYNPSSDALRTEIAWLAEQGAVDLAEDGPNLTLTLTERGEDVAAGRAAAPGIAAPSAGRSLIETRMAGIIADLVR